MTLGIAFSSLDLFFYIMNHISFVKSLSSVEECVCVSMGTCVCGGQRWTLGIFFICAPLYFEIASHKIGAYQFSFAG